MLIICVNVALQILRACLSLVKLSAQSTKVSIIYTFKKLPRNGNSEGENKLTKSNSVYRSYQEQPMGFIRVHKNILCKSLRVYELLDQK